MRHFATLFLAGLIAMPFIRSAIATDGRIFAHVGRGQYDVVGKSSNLHPFFRPDISSGTSGAKLDRPYEKSAWIRAAIAFITGPIQSVPLKFSKDARGGEKLITDPELTQWWSMPARGPIFAPLMSRSFGNRPNLLTLADTIEATVGWLKLTGEAFWLLGDTWLMRSAAKREPFIIARPDRMTPIQQGSELLGWRYLDGAGTRHALLPEQVVHLKYWNPYDDLRGSSPEAAAHTAAEADYLAGKYGLNLMRNNGDRGPIISTDGAMLSAEQQEQIIRLLRAKQEAARHGEFKPMFIPANVKVEEPKAQALDAALIAQRMENRDEIFVAFGVPPSMSHVTASYSIGSASDYFRLIETGCMPVAAKLADAIELLASVQLGGNSPASVFAWFDFSEHSTMQQVRSERLNDLQKLTALGMPAKNAGEFLSLKLPRFAGDDIGFLPFSVAPITEVANSGDDLQMLPEGSDAGQEEDSKPAPEDDSFSKITRLLEGRTIDIEASVSMGQRKLHGSVDKASRAAMWRARYEVQRAYERKFASKVSRVLTAARKDVLRRIDMAKDAGVRTNAPIVPRALAADFLFNLGVFTQSLQSEMRKVARPALDAAGDQVFKELDKDDPWSMPDGDALSYLRIRDNKIAGASEQIYEQLKGSIEEGLTEGETMDEIADRVRSTFNDIDDGRAKTIAATETSAAFGVGRQRAMEVAGVQYKQWLTSGLPNVRATHLEADKQTVRLDEPFEVGTASLMHPGDPTGPAEEVINCRCVSIAVAAPEPDEPEV